MFYIVNLYSLRLWVFNSLFLLYKEIAPTFSAEEKEHHAPPYLNKLYWYTKEEQQLPYRRKLSPAVRADLITQEHWALGQLNAKWDPHPKESIISIINIFGFHFSHRDTSKAYYNDRCDNPPEGVLELHMDFGEHDTLPIGPKVWVVS